MGATKTEVFTSQQNQLAQLCKALAHPARIAILQHLLKVNACIGNDIVEHVPLAQPTISRHLRELKSAGLIQGTVEGNATCYCIDPAGWSAAKKEITNILEAFKGLDCC
ncbi:MAG: metalloregulator ArsR/SmtB family transcription factor [Bacteroidota bacterium]